MCQRRDDVQDAQTLRLYAQKKTYLYRERDEAKRLNYLTELAELEPEQRVYLDEAGIDDSLDYAYGWSLKGQRCLADKLGHFTKRISMVAAYCQGVVLAPMTFAGYCDSLLVETYVEKVLLPELKPGQVVILDNASFHRRAKLEALLTKIGCSILFLPPYSPDLNRIEQLWHRIKSIVKHDPVNLPLHDKVNRAFCSL